MDSWFPTFRKLAGVSGSFRSWWPWYTTAAQRQSLLRLIAVATEEHLPLAPLLESWMQDERGVQRRRVRKLVRLLAEGRPLAEAIELVPGVLSEEDLLAIRFDAQSGTRTAAVRELLTSGQQAASSATPRFQRAAFYLCVVVPLGVLLAAFTQVRTVPLLVNQLGQYQIKLPPALAWSSALWNTEYLLLWLAVLAIIALLWWLLATRGGRPARAALMGRLLKPWHQWRAAGVLQNIAIAAGAGRPIPGALSTLARYHFDPTIRHELLFVRNEVEQGVDVWQSMGGVGMLNRDEVQLLSGSERSGNLPWVLRKLAGVKQGRTSRRVEWAAELLMPALVFMLAALVVFQALTVFHPLTELINALS